MENQESIYEEKQGNLLTGILGALLGALIGTALWVLVGVWGYVASIVAWLTAFLAGKGYDLLHGRPGKAKAITIIVMLILSICVGTVGTATVIMVQSYNQQISEMNTFEQARIQKYGPTVEEYVQSMLMEQDVQTEIVKNLALGMLFGALGAYPIVLGDRRKKQRQDTVQPYEAADGAPKSTANADDTDKHLDAYSHKAIAVSENQSGAAIFCVYGFLRVQRANSAANAALISRTAVSSVLTSSRS